MNFQIGFIGISIIAIYIEFFYPILIVIQVVLFFLLTSVNTSKLIDEMAIL